MFKLYVNDLVHSVTVYPNPTLGSLTIAGLPAVATRYEILDITGRSVQAGIFTGVEDHASLENLHAGPYFLIIEGNKISMIIKQ